MTYIYSGTCLSEGIYITVTIESCRHIVDLYKKSLLKEKGDLLKEIASSYNYDKNEIMFRKPFAYILQIVLTCPDLHASWDDVRTLVAEYSIEWFEKFAA